MTAHKLTDLGGLYRAGTPYGITTVCSAHPIVIRAALRHGRDTGSTVLIEATCNQVNHLGGYTNMTPTHFAQLVFSLAKQENCPPTQIILGGDHLGPNPWRDLPANEAMDHACKMISAYVSAGFGKLHLDTSMGCAGEPAALDDETTAHRAAQLAMCAEETARTTGVPPPLYTIGTEVPPPGVAYLALDEIVPTNATSARNTLQVHGEVFSEAGLSQMLNRIIALVVQPGVEFGNHNVIFYDASKAAALTKILNDLDVIVFEVHSTDYQGKGSQSELVRDGFSILKVGPELTFVLGEALYALDLIASDLLPNYGDRPLYHEMESVMQSVPKNWAHHYHGSPAQIHVMRHYSLSDRIRYYWNTPRAQAAVNQLFKCLRGQIVPLPQMRQHMPHSTNAADRALEPENILIDRVLNSLRTYSAACRQ